jgi:CRISPR/Cas system CSM-associated protein Csm3 (group 7 of RAMP superfamily)
MTVLSHHAELLLNFSGYWHAGSGRSSGNHLDALCERDASGLPYFPGRQLKGILRHAVRRAEAWGWMDDQPLPEGPVTTHEELLFGSASQSEARHHTFPGLLQVDSGCLPKTEGDWLAQPDKASLRAQLFDELFSTAIKEDGTAQQYSLRGIEVCIPVTLHAALGLRVTALDLALRTQQEKWLAHAKPWSALKISLHLIDALGANRSRGLGEATVSLIMPKKGA